MDRVGIRPVTSSRARVPTDGAANGVATNGVAQNGAGKNGAATNGLHLKKNSANSDRPGTNGGATVEPVVKLPPVTKSFGRTAVLKEINLSVAPGEVVEVT